MKTQLIAACIITGSLLAPAAGYAADGDKDRSSPKAFVKDSVITTKIKAKMAEDKTVAAHNIKVDTDNTGVVQLSGTAKSQAEADKAVSIARNTEGVTSVKSEIKVQPK